METPLTPLQQAYLLGRSDRWPLGGVAMHDFREYRGHQLDLPQLEARLKELVRHYAALRTCIDPLRLTQRVHPEASLNLDRHDLRSLSHEAAQRQVTQLRTGYSHQRHDPAQPLWRIAIVQLNETQDPPGSPYDCLIFTSFDALILDGQGISTVIARLFDRQPLAPIAPSDPAPATATAAQRQADAAYWQRKLQDVTTPSALPWLSPLANLKASGYRRASLTLPRETLKQLGRLGSAHALLRNSTLSALILDTLAHWTTDGELCVGVPVAFPSTAGELGNASSFVAVRYSRHGENFIHRAQTLQDDVLGALDHLAFSGVDLARQLLSHSQGGPALPVILTNCLSWETLPADAPVRYHDGLTQTPQVAIDIRLTMDSEKNLLLCVDYAEQALNGEQVQAMLAALQRRVLLACQNGELEIAPARFIDLAHYRHNGGEADAAPYPYLAILAERLFDARPPQTALICGERRLSYGELGQRVATLMANLQQRGLQPGSVVALYLPRSPEHVMFSLACALSGIIWVPIDINSPPERTAYLLDNCQPDLVVHQGELDTPRGVTPAALLAPADSAPALPDSQTLTERSASAAAGYYLYTSGTTGKPKCVVLNNRATANVLSQTLQRWAVTADDVFISVTPLHHDMSMFDLFGSLSAGATLVLPAPHQEKDAISWNQLVEQHRVTLWCSVPAILEMLLSCKAADGLSSLRLVAQGGDYIKPATVQTLRTLGPDITLFSLGGPTETTIWSIWHPIAAQDTGAVPYGRPLPANQYFICHDDGIHCPAGVVGRIHTAGVNLALGYLERGELKQHDFVTLADADGRPLRAFRTGDQGYYRPNGDIMFATRVNGYVKIRGVRVSLPEIEDVLRGHEAILDMVVVDYPSGENAEATLGAMYLTHDGKPLALSDIRAFSTGYLPCTHIPTRFIHADALPLSANGKTDRHRIRALLVSQHAAPALNACAAPPPGAPKARSAEILKIYWQAIGVAPQPEWGEETAFMAMGLKLPHIKEVAARLNDAFGTRLATTALLPCKNAREVAALLAS
ncbi:amino acid adenylation domain-containing protein [Serratia entomophila]|uniref:amino acid adenylation domain-containing protein n=1 Tax=Serratia entomophila TaxID=42906 RepID=UPI00217A4BA7|nr:amino acid adenylation domain-containing protein [Serratia entomophila]CAI1014899.1 Tyrocidine synthase III [Serratia entomophila]CAI1015473.1 Tyrocidine synthase III [Serratia entomophila]CAI1785713.1 Tyrocidine synthase III [Serratia entomophila]CAI1851391.1 Tyrocidine synthase III [Serratia entomophila]CAI1873129.1 Tyrocidine synthase III [Serratia entomophila]